MIIWNIAFNYIYKHELKNSRSWIRYILFSLIVSVIVSLLQFYIFADQYGKMKDNGMNMLIASICNLSVFIGYPIVRNKVNAMSESK